MEKEGKKFSRANAGDRFVRVAQLFHLLGTDPRKNIDLILDQTRSIIEGFFSLYLHRDNTQGTPVILAGSNLPRDLENTLSLGSLLFKNPLFTRHGTYPRPYCILPQEKVKSDPLGKRLGLKACLGTPVFHGARDMGTLWLTDTQARSFTPDDILCIQALSAALGLEEERLAHEKQLLTTKTRLKWFYDASFEAIFLSKRGLCLDQNKTALRMFGYSMEEAVGKPGTDWILPEDRGKVEKKMLSGTTSPYEVTALRKDGTRFPAQIQANVIDYGGEQLRVTALCTSALKGISRKFILNSA